MRRQLHALRPIFDELPGGPARRRDATLELDQLRFRNVGAKGADGIGRCAHSRHATAHRGLPLGLLLDHAGLLLRVLRALPDVMESRQDQGGSRRSAEFRSVTPLGSSSRTRLGLPLTRQTESVAPTNKTTNAGARTIRRSFPPKAKPILQELRLESSCANPTEFSHPSQSAGRG